jgi:hypothetical protein
VVKARLQQRRSKCCRVVRCPSRTTAAAFGEAKVWKSQNSRAAEKKGRIRSAKQKCKELGVYTS